MPGEGFNGAQPRAAVPAARQEVPHTDGDPFDQSAGTALDAFTTAIDSDPAALLQPVPQLASLAKSAVKALYDHQAHDHHAAGGAGRRAGSGILPELYIDGFDAEQIWLQLDLAMKPALKRARKLLRSAGQEPVLLTREAEDAVDGGTLEQEGSCPCMVHKRGQESLAWIMLHPLPLQNCFCWTGRPAKTMALRRMLMME